MKRGKTKIHLKKVIYTIIIAFAIISFWRGCWHLMDFYLFPNNELVSALVSIFLGILILSSTKNLVNHLV
jgi:hypothetical protein